MSETKPTNIREQLFRDEGNIMKVYPDSQGIPTGGVGHNIRAHGLEQHYPLGTPISPEKRDEWFEQDLAAAKKLVDALPWAAKLDAQEPDWEKRPRYGVLVNMAFQLQHKLIGFHNFLSSLQGYCDCDPAANDLLGMWLNHAKSDMLDSDWAREVPARANRLAEQLVSGEWQ